MKKIIIVSVIIFTLLLTGCSMQQEGYNTKDQSDFKNGVYVKFDIIQFKNVIDEKTLKESKLSGAYFLFMGGVSATSKEETITTNYYYCYLKNKNGGIYFAQIPTDRVRIYEDAEAPCIVGYKDALQATESGEKYYYYIDVNNEDKWNEYKKFNLHIPKGTIIPRINFDFDVNKLETK